VPIVLKYGSLKFLEPSELLEGLLYLYLYSLVWGWPDQRHKLLRGLLTVVLVTERICGGVFDKMSCSREFSELCESDTFCCAAVAIAGQLLDETFSAKDDNLNTLRGKL
jgi:hypothetical protein